MALRCVLRFDRRVPLEFAVRDPIGRRAANLRRNGRSDSLLPLRSALFIVAGGALLPQDHPKLGNVGLNTLGAACGTLLAAFVLIPQFGLTHSAWWIAGVNFSVGISVWLLPTRNLGGCARQQETKPRSLLSPVQEQTVVFVTGFATFLLEIAWFRSLTAAFFSTTAAFAIMLAVVLLALGTAAR